MLSLNINVIDQNERGKRRRSNPLKATLTHFIILRASLVKIKH